MDDVYAIEGGHVLTPDFEVREADVLVDREAGEIIEVGDVSAAETLDATDALVMPGLLNAHTHVAMTLLRGYADDKPLDAWLQEDIWPVEAELTPDDIRVGTELDLFGHREEVVALLAEPAPEVLRGGIGVLEVAKAGPRAEDVGVRHRQSVQAGLLWAASEAIHRQYLLKRRI